MELTGAHSEWREQDVILDLYRVEGVLGEGGMGRVYRVRHTGWNIDLAVKTPLAKYLTEEGKRNFTHEAETWVNLGLYPHAVSCYYVRDVDGLPRLFAECVEGGSLKDWIDNRRLYEGGAKAALEFMLDVAVQFAWGLHYAHEQGLVHQDVKPANVMMTPEGVAKVTDFGLAQARAASGEVSQESDPTRSIVVAGAGAMTPAYCSPEQRAKEPLTRRTDVWSWGASVLEMFAGGVQWMSGPEVEEALNSYLEEWSEGARKEAEGVPKMPVDVVTLLRWCFRRSPQQRPRDMRQVAEALGDIYRKETGKVYPRTEPKAGKSLADGLNNRAASLLDLGKQSEALALWDEALRVQPHHAEATYNRGLVSWRAAEIGDETLFIRLEGVKTSNRAGWWADYLLSLVHLERNDVAAAISILEKITSVAGEQTEVSSLLQQARASLRGSAKVRYTIKETERVEHVSYSPDGKLIVSALFSAVKLWDAETGRFIRNIGGDDMVHNVCFSPDGSLLAVTGSEVVFDPGSRQLAMATCTKLFVTETGKYLVRSRHYRHNGGPVCFSPDGRQLVTGSPDIKLWDIKTANCLRKFAGHPNGRTPSYVTSVAFSPDGQLIASGSNKGTAKLWNVLSGECVHTLKTGWIFESVCFSPDGKLLATGSRDHTSRLWDVKSGECLNTFYGHTETVSSVCFSADQKLLASGSWDHTVKLWETATGKCVRTLKGHTDHVNSVSFSPDGESIASGSSDNTMQVWEVALDHVPSPILLSRISASEENTRVEESYEQHLADARAALESDEPAVAANHLRSARALPGCERRTEAVELWASLYSRLNRASLKSAWYEDNSRPAFRDQIITQTLSPDGTHIAATDFKTIKLYQTATGECVRDFEGHESRIHKLSFNPDGKVLASAGCDQTVKLWDTQTGECLRVVQAHSDFVYSVSFSPDGKLFASCSGDKDNTIKIWDVATGEGLWALMLVPKKPSLIGHVTYSICFSPDGRLLASGGSDRVVRVWEVATGKCLKNFKKHNEAINSVSFSPDGTLIASASEDKRVILWDFEFKMQVGEFWHDDSVISVAFSPDGRHLASASEDKTVKLWDRKTQECVRTLDGHTAGVREVSFSPDARYILSCSESGIHNVFSLLWFLDWELEERDPVYWDAEASPYLKNFMILHTPYAAKLPSDRKPKESQITRALTRKGLPSWDEKDFERLMLELRRAGFSHLKPDSVRHMLKSTVRDWEDSPPQLLHSYIPPVVNVLSYIVGWIILAVIVYYIVWPLLVYLLLTPAREY